MRISAISDLATYRDEPSVLAICQRACGVSAAAQSLLLLPILVAVMVPSAMIAAEAIAEPATLDRLTASPVNTAGAFIGVAIWLFMFGIPAFHALRRLGWSRKVEIGQNVVSVEDRSLLSSRTINLPLREFEGISHHVRTNLSGTRQELVLIHPTRSKSLLIQMADTISQEETEALARRLATPLLPAGLLFRREPVQRRSWSRFIPLLKPQQAY